MANGSFDDDLFDLALERSLSNTVSQFQQSMQDVPPICRECGCTENDACLLPDGSPCRWVSPGLCSACVPENSSRIQVYSDAEATEYLREHAAVGFRGGIA